MSRVIVRRDEPGLRSETVRRSNLSAIGHELHTGGPISRSELGARTGLTRSAIRALIGEFAVAGLVSEEPSAPLGAPGRPSSLVYPRAEAAVGLALEIAVDSLSAAVVGFGGEVLELLRLDNPRGEMSVERAVEMLAKLAHAVRGLPPQREVVGIGVAVVGVVRRSDGLVSMAPNLGWRDVALGQGLRRNLDTLIPIFVANEADLGALAELRRGAARGRQNVIFIAGEVGVGGGLIFDGRPLTGAAGYSGEIGHMPLNAEGGSRCRCGSVGCWETEIGENVLLSLAGHAGEGGREAVGRVLEEAAAGSQAALAALDHVALGLGRGLGGLINVLNPELVVLGGLFGRIHPFIARTLESQLDRYALPASRAAVSVVPAALAENATLLGAAELAFDPFLADPAGWLRPRAGLLELAPA